jgi:serine/threonine protein kinase
MAHNYKYGSFLYNYENYGKTMLKNAVPFSVDYVESVDEKLMKPPPIIKGVKLTNCSHITTTAYGGDIYMTSYGHVENLIKNITKHYDDVYVHLDFDRHSLCNMTNPVDSNIQKYIVKVSPASTKRRMMTNLKELLMMDAVFKSEYDKYKGSDIAPKPIFGCPVWTGRRWKFVIIMEKVSGKPFSQIYSPFNRLLNFGKYNKNDIMNSLTSSLITFWMLGFAHNDLRDANVMYDMNTNKSKIIDFESVVKIPDVVVNQFRIQMIQDPSQDPSDMFENIYKKPALSLLSLSSMYCERYEDEDNTIYNTDDFFLRIAKTVL